VNATCHTLIDGRTFVEAPRWHEGRFWFSELYTHSVMSAEEDGSDLQLEALVPGQPSGMDWLPDGRLLVTSMKDRLLLRREHDGTMVVHADLSQCTGGFCNEVIVDKQGRAYVGDFGFDLDGGGPLVPASIHRIDPDGAITKVAGDLYFPNGCVLTDDGQLIVNETFGNRVSAFDLTEDGDLVNRRTWAEFGDLPPAGATLEPWSQFAVCPDGMCRDAEGALWIADLSSRKVLRVAEGGAVLAEVDPGMMPFSATLGGEDGRTLFICAAPDGDVEARTSTTLAAILTVRVDVPAASHAWTPS
jgi:sugar lactone lactonase YvrE